jgi:hypothetical protein
MTLPALAPEPVATRDELFTAVEELALAGFLAETSAERHFGRTGRASSAGVRVGGVDEWVAGWWDQGPEAGSAGGPAGRAPGARTLAP